MTKKQTLILGVFVVMLITLGMITRFVPHPGNFTAVGAVALLAGAAFPKKWGVVIPVVIMIVSDLMIGFHSLVLFTWGSMALSGFIGWKIRSSMNMRSVVGASLFASVQFFLITNWAVWLFTPLYSKDISGLFQSYVLGLPFFRNMLIGDLVYTAVLFGLYAVAVQGVRMLQLKESQQ